MPASLPPYSWPRPPRTRGRARYQPPWHCAGSGRCCPMKRYGKKWRCLAADRALPPLSPSPFVDSTARVRIFFFCRHQKEGQPFKGRTAVFLRRAHLDLKS
ncbi:MAG: hypothetical protein BJ554DRAFT_3586 [Olpidium bornovanus]|uniref:Uncharacterized protein n=1 Tax=Olpidium bornovanus TaxID=278681 RepID=A0A8H8DFU7_9FUNG|nr:MAG: hypothetical protein BJ554DRAFT_3586 [Olpidium bornovanus]